jgi:hypothetical protein
MPISFWFKVRDAKGDESTREIYLPTATTPANAQAFGLAMLPLLDAILVGGIVGGGINLSLDLTGISQVAGSVSDLQEMARFAFRDAAGFLTSLTLPTFAEAKMVASSKQVDLADADVAAFVTAMTGGLSGQQPVSLHEDDLVTVETAVEAWGNARK